MTGLRTHARALLDNLNLLPGRSDFKKLGKSINPRTFVLFVGNPVSGTTLVRSLLDAHPNITISHELSLVASFAQGERSWDYLCGAMLDNAARFADNPVWNDYQYDVPYPCSKSASELNIIGDKWARGTAALFNRKPELIDHINAWSPIPVIFVHCVRHPLDVIATKTTKNGSDTETNTISHFMLEDVALAIKNKMPANGYYRLYLEDLISDPRKSLASIIEFLGTEAIPEYMEACEKRIFDKPRKSRNDAKWSILQREAVEKGISERPHLHRYQQDLEI